MFHLVVLAFYIQADNITLDCNGFFITAGTGGGDYSFGVRAQTYLMEP